MENTPLQFALEDLDDILKGFKCEPSDLIPVLQAVQEKYGYIPKESVKPVANALHLFPSQVQGVMTFYSQFALTPRGRNIIRVCRGTACHVRGGRGVLRGVEKTLGIEDGRTSEDFKFTLETVACLGACALSPVMVVNKAYHGQMNPKKIEKILQVL
jgi:NADH-quinone oxidoreductase subunit E/NADP-reducing hydrogenase subunit HndA